MTSEQKAAYIQAQAVAMQAEIESMKAANYERDQQGFAIAYDEAAFFNLIDKYDLGCNSIISFFHS